MELNGKFLYVKSIINIVKIMIASNDVALLSLV